MGIYTDYVNMYADLQEAYKKSGPPNYTAYVDNYPDLLAAYNSSGTPNYDSYVDNNSDLAAAYINSGTPNFTSYVNSHPDLLAAFNSSKTSQSKEDWGKAHWKDFGSRENRYLPRTYSQTKADWGQDHWESSGKREGRTLPTTPTQTKEAWGATHWASSGQRENRTLPTTPNKTEESWGAEHWSATGKNENRILPGAKIGLNNNGTVYIANPGLIGAGAKNTYNNLVNNINNASSGSYSNLLKSIDSGLNENELSDFVNNSGVGIVEASYTTKINPWDSVSQGAQPPVGGFNANYYSSSTTSGANAVKEWNSAQRSLSLGGVPMPNLDITKRYTKDTYLHWHYTTQGKAAGARGNAPVAETQTEAYKYAEKLTDFEKQLYRDQVLGITTDPSGNQKLVIASPQYDEEGKLINEDEVNTVLERTFAKTVSADDAKREKQLGSMAQELLQMSISELKKAKQEESNITLLSQLPGYSEIMNINSTLANSIIGDSGIGGILSLTGKGKEYQEQLEKDFGSLTGVSSNSTIYNWQKWFDETLLKKYEDYTLPEKVYSDEEIKTLQATAKEDVAAYDRDRTIPKPIYLEVAEKYKEGNTPLDINKEEDFKKILFYIDRDSNKEFVKSFVDGYLKPRFDQSKSMDEFISYLDVKEEEQNVFQSQTTINKLKQIADLRSKTFLDLIQSSEKATANFNPDFYLDPVTNNTKQVGAKKLSQYEYQKQLIAEDFENAKNGVIGSDGIDWAKEAYLYGFEGSYKTDPKVFAKLHYQAKGSTGAVKDPNTGEAILLDPAQDILPYDELDRKIKDFGVEMAARREFYGGAGFMKFVTPEEFADAVLGSISPEENKEEWEKILKSIGLEGQDATLEQVKEYLTEQLRTEEAKNIRESIKYLNENEEDLNQKTLGVSYIERPTDVKQVEGERTVLYDVFKNAGYGGTEDEFYTEFFPDVDRTEQQVISKITSGKGLESSFGDMENPFQAFSGLSGLFEDDTSIGGAAFIKDTQEEQDQAAASQSSYFKIFEDDEEQLPEKSAAATSFLKDFTSLFKGFS